MTDINQGEKEKLYQWACENYSKEIEEKYFTKIDKKCNSYFEKRRHQLEYGREYDFQTLPELKSELDVMWSGDDVMKLVEKVVLVASMKNKILEKKEEDQKDEKDRVNQLSPFIYNF